MASTADRIEAAVAAPYTRIIRHDPADGGFSALVLELPGVFGGGDTAEEANESLDEAIRIWVEYELEQGHDIPEPFDPGQFSGRVTLRMTPSLHERAQLRAALEGVSLNRLLELAIAQYLGSDHPKTVTLNRSQQVKSVGRRTTHTKAPSPKVGTSSVTQKIAPTGTLRGKTSKVQGRR